MASSKRNQQHEPAVEPYHMHVSQRYLDLTQQKLQLARLPREPPAFTQGYGVRRAELEPLLDFWLESYDCRAQEEMYNNRLPQYRTNITYIQKPHHEATSLRVHFVHRKSTFANAVPLLVCHDWGSSFIEVSKMIDTLCEPISTPPLGNVDVQAFHVVCPSIPGFGFSDASPNEAFGLQGTAEVFRLLMERLGYERFLLHGSGWGFKIARSMALHNPQSCIAVHAANADHPRPQFRPSPVSWLKYHIARLTGARVAYLSFGYVPSDFAATPTNTSSHSPLHDGFQDWLSSHVNRPQTISYGLADSPTGLLSFFLDFIKPPSLDIPEFGVATPPVWSPPDIITWVMLYWLPGPEAALRWLRNAAQATSPAGSSWYSYSSVPLGISCFKPRASEGTVPPIWAAAYQNSVWLRRHERSARWPAWEAPQELVLDLRDFAGELKAVGIWNTRNDGDEVDSAG